MSAPDPRTKIHTLAVRREKLVAYLLDRRHPHGASKAAFFIGRGFSAAEASLQTVPRTSSTHSGNTGGAAI